MSEGLSLFAASAPGLELLVLGELGRLGIRGRAEPGGVAWQGTLEDLYRANLHLRTASRLLVRVGRFEARAFWELEKAAKRLPWKRFLPADARVALRVTSKRSRLYHERAIAERILGVLESLAGPVSLAAAVSDDDDDEGVAALPPQLFVVRVFRDRVTVSADASGALLHRRRYREAVAKAPLRETTAAALLLAGEWAGGAPLLDPFCGSGTIPIEAALMARRIPPGLAAGDRSPRVFAFQGWPEFAPTIFDDVVGRALEAARPSAGIPIVASDRDRGAIRAAAANAERAGVQGDVELSVRSLSDVAPPPGPGWLVTNPPWGARVGERAGLRDLYAALGNFARRSLPGWRVVLLSADSRLEGQVGLSLEERLRTRSGGIGVRVVVGTANAP